MPLKKDAVPNSSLIASAVIEECLRLGVREFCVCAGSRNSDLVLALLQRVPPNIRLHSFFDERAAGFFALGRIIATERPVAVVTTSGTAVAELLPPTVEAFYQNLPLLLITADRPGRYQATGAPQAILQEGIFGSYAKFHRSIELPEHVKTCFNLWEDQGPVHLNVRFEEPQASQATEIVPFTLKNDFFAHLESTHTQLHEKQLTDFLNTPGPLLVIVACLPELRPEARSALIRSLVELNAPLVVEATSGLLGEPKLGHLMIRTPDPVVNALHLERVLRIGGVPSGRYWRDFDDRPELTIASISQRPFVGRSGGGTLIVAPAETLASTKRNPQAAPQNWKQIADGHSALLDTLIEQFPESEVAWIRRISAKTEPGDTVFLGNSLPIREWNLVGRSKARCFANRGANGIDGCLSTFIGAAASSETAWGIFGDLTTLYDLNAPWILPKLENQRFRFVIIHNGGGRIFRRLPNFAGLSEAHASVVENRHTLKFASWASMWGLDYQCFCSSEGFESLSLNGNTVIEIRPDLEQSDAFARAWAKGPSDS